MRTSMKTTFGAAALLAGVIALGAAPASAGVTGCSAPGGKQEVGAVLGAVAGGLLGSKLGGRHDTAETVVGAGAGAAAGSAIGCEMQKDRAEKASAGGTYTRNGYRLSSEVSPASYSRMGQTYVADSTVNLRSAPSARSGRVGSLRRGERFQALAAVRGSDWILVGQGGVGIGYVRGDLVRPATRYASY
jgi:uncharacterized protein YgiM (DUF1202 family)